MVAVLVIATAPADGELAADALWQAGAMAVVERDGRDGRVELCAALGADAEPSPSWPAEWDVWVEEIDESLADGWRSVAEVSDLGNGWAVVPAWRPELAEGWRKPVHIDPGPTFGMGDHPTTRLTAMAMLALGVVNRSVLDVGSGSGVLAVVAALAGAAHAHGIDITPAVESVGPANAALNGVIDRVSFATTPLDEVAGEWDLVLANILAPTLIALADDLRRCLAPNGKLVVSGVLQGRYDHVLRALAPLHVEHETFENGWAAVVLSA